MVEEMKTEVEKIPSYRKIVRKKDKHVAGQFIQVYKVNCETVGRDLQTLLLCFVEQKDRNKDIKEEIKTSSIKNTLITSLTIYCVAGPATVRLLESPNGILTNSYRRQGVMKAVMCLDPSAM